jgi:hypothetical protein
MSTESGKNCGNPTHKTNAFFNSTKSWLKDWWVVSTTNREFTSQQRG